MKPGECAPAKITIVAMPNTASAILFLLVIGTASGDTPGWIADLVRIALAVFGIATIVIFAGAHSPGFIVSATSRLGNKLGPRWHDRLVSLATSITNAGACLRDPRDAIMLIVYSLIIWSLDAALFIAILPAFGIPHSLRDGVVAMSVTNLGLLVPSSPGFIGPFHYFCSRALIAHGVAEPVALAYATLVHLAIYIPITLWGAAAMLWYGVEVGSTAAAARQAKRSLAASIVRGVAVHRISPVTPERAAEPPSAFTKALVEAMVGDTPGASAYAAEFVHGQLDALQPKLRFLYEVGMTGFRFATRLRFLRGFCNVPLAARRKWTMQWAEGRIALVRQLFKPVRATALLAYYDHEAVRGPLLAAPIAASSLVRAPATEEPARAEVVG